MRCCPISPFTETAGTFVNCEGRVQTLQRRRARRSAKRVPRGKCCACWDRCSACRSSISNRSTTSRAWLPAAHRHRGAPANATRVAIAKPSTRNANGLERVADVPIHFADPLVRRAPSLQQTARREAAEGTDERADARADRRRGRRAGQGDAGTRRGGAGDASSTRPFRPASSASRPRIRRRAASTGCPARSPWSARSVDTLDTLLCTGAGAARPAWPVVWTLVKIIVIAVPLILGVAYLTFAERKIIGWMQVRIGPNRVGPLGLAAAVRRCLQAAVQGDHRPDGGEPRAVLHCADAGARAGARRVGGDSVRRRRRAVRHQRRAFCT